MDYDYTKTVFSKALLTGLFAGIIATLACLFFNIFFRETTRFPLASIVNVSSLIFGVNLIFVIIGILYYGFISTFKKGDIFYIVVFVLLTLFLIWKTVSVERSDNAELNHEFKELFVGILIIMGASAAFLLPLLFHSKRFEKHVL